MSLLAYLHSTGALDPHLEPAPVPLGGATGSGFGAVSAAGLVGGRRGAALLLQHQHQQLRREGPLPLDVDVSDALATDPAMAAALLTHPCESGRSGAGSG